MGRKVFSEMAEWCNRAQFAHSFGGFVYARQRLVGEELIRKPIFFLCQDIVLCFAVLRVVARVTMPPPRLLAVKWCTPANSSGFSSLILWFLLLCVAFAGRRGG